MRRRHKTCNKGRVIKIIGIVVSVLLVFIIAGAFLAILFLIEWIFPNLFDIVSF